MAIESTNKADEPQVQARFFTGAEYLESLKDGREVYIYGDRVRDLPQHPAFRNSARMLAALPRFAVRRRSLVN